MTLSRMASSSSAVGLVMPSFSGAVTKMTWLVGVMNYCATAFTASTVMLRMSMLSSCHSVLASGTGEFLR